jgi:hypothetical protein
VEDAVSAVSTIADHEVVSLGLTVTRDGPAVTATANLLCGSRYGGHPPNT